MVVFVIIAVLLSIAIPVFNACKGNAQRKSCFANQRTLEGAAQAYEADNGSPPPSGDTTVWAVDAYVRIAPSCPAASTHTPYTMTVPELVDGCTYGGGTGHGHY